MAKSRVVRLHRISRRHDHIVERYDCDPSNVGSQPALSTDIVPALTEKWVQERKSDFAQQMPPRDCHRVDRNLQ
jgi:hypothetical protein